jgi:hypothetical protein
MSELLASFFPAIRSPAGMTVQLEKELRRCLKKEWSRLRSSRSLMAKSGIRRCTQCPAAEQHHHELTHDVVLVVRLVLGDGGQGPVLVGAAEAAVVQAVNDHRRIRGESGAVGLHLR